MNCLENLKSEQKSGKDNRELSHSSHQTAWAIDPWPLKAKGLNLGNAS